MFYLRKPGGFSVQEWEQAIAATPNTRVKQLPTESLVEVGDEQVWVTYGGPGAEVKFAYDRKVWVRSGDTHFWLVSFFYRDGYVYFELHEPDDPGSGEYPVRAAALKLAEVLQTRIVDGTGAEQDL